MKYALIFKGRSSGVSLLISIVFVSSFMLVIGGLYEARVAVIRSIGNREAEAKALYLVETVEELATFAAARAETLSASDSAAYQSLLAEVAGAMGVTSCGTATGGGANSAGETATAPCGIEIQGKPVFNAQLAYPNSTSTPLYYSVPSPVWVAAPTRENPSAKIIKGTGDAAEACDTALNPTGTDANDPCHWNKMYVGQSADIPLAKDGTTASFRSGSGFYLRVRTPACEPNSTGGAGTGTVNTTRTVGCESSSGDNYARGRFMLYPKTTDTTAYLSPDKDPVLMTWSITGTISGGANDGQQETLVANVKMDNRSLERRDAQDLISTSTKFFNTELSAGRVNKARNIGDFNVLFFGSKGTKIADKSEPSIFTALSSLTSPVLHLKLADRPRTGQDVNASAFNVPYLEYQLLTTPASPCTADTCDSIPSDSKKIIRGWVQVGAYRKEFTKYLNRTGGSGGFVLENL